MDHKLGLTRRRDQHAKNGLMVIEVVENLLLRMLIEVVEIVLIVLHGLEITLQLEMRPVQLVRT